MISGITFQRYINRLDEVIISGNTAVAEELQDEILAVFGSDLDGLKRDLTNYQPCSIITLNGQTTEASDQVDFIKMPKH